MVTEGNREISFVIERHLGVLSESENGWRKELNLVSWNGKKAKLDIREWSPDHQHMAKGVTLRYEEARLLQRALYRWFTGRGKPAAESAPPEVPAEAPAEAVHSDGFLPADEIPAADPETGEIVETQAEMPVELPAEFFEEAPGEAAGEMAGETAEISDVF